MRFDKMVRVMRDVIMGYKPLSSLETELIPIKERVDNGKPIKVIGVNYSSKDNEDRYYAKENNQEDVKNNKS